jgi:hypothetical protein
VELYYLYTIYISLFISPLYISSLSSVFVFLSISSVIFTLSSALCLVVVCILSSPRCLWHLFLLDVDGDTPQGCCLHAAITLSWVAPLCGMFAWPSTTLLVSPGTKGFDLPGVNKPPDEVLEQPEEHLLMDARQRASRRGGGEKPLQKAEAA